MQAENTCQKMIRPIVNNLVESNLTYQSLVRTYAFQILSELVKMYQKSLCVTKSGYSKTGLQLCGHKRRRLRHRSSAAEIWLRRSPLASLLLPFIPTQLFPFGHLVMTINPPPSTFNCPVHPQAGSRGGMQIYTPTHQAKLPWPRRAIYTDHLSIGNYSQRIRLCQASKKSEAPAPR